MKNFNLKNLKLKISFYFIVAFFAFFFAFTYTQETMQASAQGSHNYFDMLSNMSEAVVTKAYRTQAEIDADPYGSQKQDVKYDATEDAARLELPDGGDGTNDASIPIANQLRPPIPLTPMTSGNLLFFYEVKHESGFASNGTVDGLKTHKAVQIAKDTSRVQAIEPRYRFSQVDLPYVARVDVRVYGGEVGYIVGPNDTIAPQTGEFNVLPDVWVRHWLFLDIDNKQLSYWVGDENRANVTILDNVDLDYNAAWPGQNFDTFWFEFNSSSIRDAGAPALDLWVRNLVVLKDVSNAPSLVAQGDSGNTVPPPSTCTSFTYSSWSPTTCPSSQTQTRTVLTSSPSGCEGGTPVTSQSCTYTPSLPPSTTLSIANTTTMTANSQNFDQDHQVEHLWDGCLDGKPACTSGSNNITSFWIEFDFGQNYDLTHAKLYGDSVGNWWSKDWTLKYRQNTTEEWQTAFSNTNVFFNDWSTQDLTNITARYVRIEINGNPDKPATQARELEIYGTASGQPSTTPQGDLDGNGTINTLDWSIMNSRWNTNDTTADINNDGIVNTIDFSIMNNNWSG